MAIQVGSKVPSVKVKVVSKDGTKEANTADLFAGKKVVLFAVPGAFTPLCSAQHLPGFVSKADEIRKKGVDEIFCLSVNDGWVMDAWAKDRGALGKVTLIADGSGEFTKAVGLPRLRAHWVRPQIVVQVAFTEWTPYDKLRHPRLLGLRPDKSAREVVRERPA